MKGHHLQPHPIDHSLIFREEDFSSPRREIFRPVKIKTSPKRTRWLSRVGERLSRRLFDFETKNIKFSL